MEFIFRYLRKRLDRESKRLIRNSTWLFLSNANSTVCFFIRSILLVRLLAADGFGLFILIGTYIRVLLELANLNLPTALTKFGAEYLDEENSCRLALLVKMFLAASLFTTVIGLAILYYALGHYYNFLIDLAGLENHILLYAAAIGCTFLGNIFTPVLQLKNKFRIHATLKIVQDWVELAIILYFSFSADVSVKNLLLLLSIAIIAHTAMYIITSVILLRDELPLLTGSSRKIPRATLRKIFNFIAINSPSNTIMMGIRYIDVITLGMFSNTSQVAYYTIAKRLGFFVLRFTDPMTQAIFPQLSVLVAKKRISGLIILINNTLKLGSIPILIILFLGFFIGEEVIMFLYTQEFSESFNSFLILLVSGCLSAMFFWITPLTLSLGMAKERLIANLLVLLFLLPASIYLSITYGSTGIAVAMLSANILHQYILSRYVIPKLG